MNTQPAPLSDIFKSLRRQGLIARQNYLCCTSCAGCAIANDAEKLIDAGKSPVGAVFFHRQNATSYGDTGKLIIHYGRVDTVKHGPVGIDSVKVGEMVATAFRESGWSVKWDGSPNTCIEVS